MNPLKAPDALAEPEAPRGPRTLKTQDNKLPMVWTPRLLDTADGRCTLVKTLKARVERLKEDVGADSYQRELLCERAGFLLAVLETAEVNATEGRGLDVGGYIQAVNGLAGLLNKLGLKKAKKTLDLKTYLAQKEGKAEA